MFCSGGGKIEQTRVFIQKCAIFNIIRNNVFPYFDQFHLIKQMPNVISEQSAAHNFQYSSIPASSKQFICPMAGSCGLLPVMSGHSQPVVPKKMRTSLLRELNSNSTYEHTHKHKNLAEMFPCSTHGMCIRIHQTQRMVQVPFNVFMGCQTFKYYFTTKWVPDNIKFYYPFTS